MGGGKEGEEEERMMMVASRCKLVFINKYINIYIHT